MYNEQPNRVGMCGCVWMRWSETRQEVTFCRVQHSVKGDSGLVVVMVGEHVRFSLTPLDMGVGDIVILAGVWKGSTFSRPECNFSAWQSAFGFGLFQGVSSKIRGFQCFSCLWYCYEDKGRKGSSNLNSIPCNETTLRLWRSNYSPEMWCNLSNDVVRLVQQDFLEPSHQHHFNFL